MMTSSTWAEICLCCFGCTCTQLLWPRTVIRKWLNINSAESDFAADTDNDDIDNNDADADDDAFFDEREDGVSRLRRRNSETFRAQYINKKDVRICAGTWNVAGKVPPDDLDIDEWINVNEPADIYVIGLQEIVPLNAGNIFGAEDNRPAIKWENLIRETLSRINPDRKSYKSYSDPPSPTKFKTFDDSPDFEDEILLGSDSDGEEEVHPCDEEPIGFYEVKDKMASEEDLSVCNGVSGGDKVALLDMKVEKDLKKQFSSSKRLDRLQCFQSGLRDEEDEPVLDHIYSKLDKQSSRNEKPDLNWPEPPLNLLAQHVLDRPYSFKSTKSFKMQKSFKAYNSFKMTGDRRALTDATALAELDLESLIERRRRPEYVRIVSKQMVGIFLTVWVRRSLRKHIQNLKVSTVGVGVMGFIGNKGSVSVSMSIYQTLFCFICTHLTSGEREVDQNKRNTDVHDIHRRTLFRSDSGLGLPKSIYDHERIIWLGDLNYRLNLSYDETRKLISKEDWSKLSEKDQLVREFKKGRAFDGWCEGIIDFPPTYKYEMNSDKYCGEDPTKPGRRIPAWCDRILSRGKGIKLLNYKRSELKFSDHRPVTATFDVEVEVVSPKKLQRALTFTDAEIQKEEILIEKEMNAAIGHLRLEEDMFDWGR